MIIGLSGKAGSGKDTFAKALTDLFGFRRGAFADNLKTACGAIFGLSHEQMYTAAKEVPDPYWATTPRDLLQRAGMAVREMMGADIWVRSLMRQIQTHPIASWAIADIRFPNEAEAITREGGFVVRIERPGAGLSGAAAQHISETALDAWDFDAMVRNDGTLAQLEEQAGALYLQLLDLEHMRSIDNGERLARVAV